jgi:hypothetical protein
VRREGVNKAAGALQKNALINYTRGRIKILDRAGLEAVSCECYAIIRGEFERLLEGRASPSPLDGVSLSVGGRSIVRGAASRAAVDDPSGDVEPLH